MTFDVTFGGRVAWQMRPSSLGTEIDANALYEQFIAPLSLDVADHIDHARFICRLIACTEGIEFTWRGDERPGLRALERFWRLHQTAAATAREFWGHIAYFAPYITQAWAQAMIAESSTPYGAPPSHLPTSALSESQQAEARDERSPLAVAAATSGGG
jgi:hypothetical protein